MARSSSSKAKGKPLAKARAKKPWFPALWLQREYSRYPVSNLMYHVIAAILHFVLGTVALVNLVDDDNAPSVSEHLTLTRSQWGDSPATGIAPIIVPLSSPRVLLPAFVIVAEYWTCFFEFVYAFMDDRRQGTRTVLRFGIEYPVSVSCIGFMLLGASGITDVYVYTVFPLLCIPALWIGAGLTSKQAWLDPNNSTVSECRRPMGNPEREKISSFLFLVHLTPPPFQIFLGDPPDEVYIMVPWITVTYGVFGVVAHYHRKHPTFNDDLAYTWLSLIIKQVAGFVFLYLYYQDAHEIWK